MPCKLSGRVLWTCSSQDNTSRGPEPRPSPEALAAPAILTLRSEVDLHSIVNARKFHGARSSDISVSVGPGSEREADTLIYFVTSLSRTRFG
eukprot:750292-Hanusia_phi.AAC.3